jgi:hypothetical protein
MTVMWLICGALGAMCVLALAPAGAAAVFWSLLPIAGVVVLVLVLRGRRPPL